MLGPFKIKVEGSQAISLVTNASTYPNFPVAASRRLGPLKSFTSTTAPKYPTEVIVC